MRPVFLDVSVFVSAIKGSETCVEIVERTLGRDEVELVTNWILVNELMRMSVELKTGNGKCYRLLKGMVEEFVRRSYTVDPERSTVRMCYERLPDGEYASAVHAATCVEANAVMVTRNKSLLDLREAGLIEAYNPREFLEMLKESESKEEQ
ncbi:type II toxin-antitoxin system VapC family toxin [Methanopyrus sp.]